MVVKYILLSLGLFELISNLIHISKRSVDQIGLSAKRQHQEISSDLPNIHFFYKVIIMLAFGVSFLTAGIIDFTAASFSSLLTAIVTISFGIYGFLQAIIYRSTLKVWPAMVVYNLPFIAYIFLK